MEGRPPDAGRPGGAPAWLALGDGDPAAGVALRGLADLELTHLGAQVLVATDTEEGGAPTAAQLAAAPAR